MKQRKAPLFSELEAHWYKKLYDSGFRDIENTKNKERPLIEWHSFKFVSEEAQIQKSRWEAYQTRMDSFANSPDFYEIVNLMIKDGNNVFLQEEVIHIWELHRAGKTERKIAREMEVSQSCIHFLLKKMRTWMMLS